jgi:hypothetical protein
MGWAHCGVNPETGEAMGYGVAGICAHPGCDAKINHGLAYACGGMHEGGEHGCGRYFCAAHLFHAFTEGEEMSPQLCEGCAEDFGRNDT